MAVESGVPSAGGLRFDIKAPIFVLICDEPIQGSLQCIGVFVFKVVISSPLKRKDRQPGCSRITLGERGLIGGVTLAIAKSLQSPSSVRFLKPCKKIEAIFNRHFCLRRPSALRPLAFPILERIRSDSCGSIQCWQASRTLSFKPSFDKGLKWSCFGFGSTIIDTRRGGVIFFKSSRTRFGVQLNPHTSRRSPLGNARIANPDRISTPRLDGNSFHSSPV